MLFLRLYNFVLGFLSKMSIAVAECSWQCACSWLAKGTDGSRLRTNFGIFLMGTAPANIVGCSVGDGVGTATESSSFCDNAASIRESVALALPVGHC